MGVFEMIVCIVAMSVGGGIIMEVLKKRTPKKEAFQSIEARLEKLEALEERITTLEKIVTTPKKTLSDEIESL